MTTINAELRALSQAAGADISAPHDLSSQVLGRLVRTRRRRVAGVASIAAVAVVALGASLGAARLGGGPYFKEIQASSAMSSTIEPGEAVTFNRDLSARAGDVVRLKLPSARSSTLSRVIATGGHTVSCPPEPDGTCAGIRVDGTPLSDRYLASLVTAPFPAVVVTAGEVFVLGDNRGAAVDSRLVGPIGRSAIEAVAVAITRGDHLMAIPGAPRHDVPGDSDPVDPPGPLPVPHTSQAH